MKALPSSLRVGFVRLAMRRPDARSVPRRSRELDRSRVRNEAARAARRLE
jgi:hypothetical protein